MNDKQADIKKGSSTKAVAAASIGNALEWYDFSVFAFFAAYIGHSFFIDGDETSALIRTFVVFAAGFIARPLGAVFLGLYGDRVGRKAALTLTIALMAIGTFIIAIAPPVVVIGAGAPLLLLVGRLFQGFSAGGEIGGATAFLVESAPKEKQASYSAWLQASMGISNILAALVGVTVTTLYADSEINDWAWRIPFFVGLLIIPVGYYIRRNLDETEDFKAQKKMAVKQLSFLQIIKTYPKHLVIGFMFSILWTVSIYTLIIYMPTYYASSVINLGFTKNQAFTASLVGNVFMVVGCLLSGRWADRVGIRSVLMVGIGILFISSYPLLLWLHSNPTFTTLVAVHISFCIMVSVFSGVAPVALATLYPVAVRSTGMAISYNVAAIFFAGFTPALLTWATSAIDIYTPAFYLMLACLVAFVAVYNMFSLNNEQVYSSALTDNLVKSE